MGDRLRHLVLPVITIVLSHVGSFSRFIQEGMKEELGSYYVTVARPTGSPLGRIYWGL